MPRLVAISEFFTLCGSAGWQPSMPQVRSTTRRSPGLRTMPAWAFSLSTVILLPRWQGEQPISLASWAVSSFSSVWHEMHISRKPAVVTASSSGRLPVLSRSTR